MHFTLDSSSSSRNCVLQSASLTSDVFNITAFKMAILMCPNVGSYFALNAKYSHSYTSDSKVRSMFAVRLLVGEYTKGSPEYRRPPSKDGGDINFYDSCVDDVDAPSIYVVFDKHQIYPEYLLQYQEYGAGISSIASVQASGISQSLYSNQASRPQPTLSFSSTAASSSHSTQKNSSEEKSCTVS